MLEAITHCVTCGKSSVEKKFSTDDYEPNIPEVIPVEIPVAAAPEAKEVFHGHCHGSAAD